MYFYSGDPGDDEEKKREEPDLFGFDAGPPPAPPQPPAPPVINGYGGGGYGAPPVQQKSNTGIKILCIVLTVLVIVSNIVTIIVAMNLSKNNKTQYVTNDAEMLSKVVAANTVDQVALITITLPAAKVYGSGYVVYATFGQAYVMTNAHVAIESLNETPSGFTQKSTANVAAVIDGTNYAGGQVKAIDKGRDMAVILFETGLLALNAVQFGDSSALTYGDFVQVEGNPYGDGLTVTPGVVTAVRKDMALSTGNGIGATAQTVIQTNAAINPGNSGGPLFDKDGLLVGMNTAKRSQESNEELPPEGTGYAIASAEVITFLNTKSTLPFKIVNGAGVAK